jgi:hypothetical protein
VSYQINFVPNLKLGDKDITLSGIKDAMGNFKGYEFNPEKDSTKAVGLGTLSTLKADVCNLAELDSTSLDSRSITELLPAELLPGFLRDATNRLEDSLSNTYIKLLHFKIDTSSNEKEITIIGNVEEFKIYSFSATGFSLEITSGPDGKITSIDKEKKEISVKINKRGMNVIDKDKQNQKYTMKGSRDASKLDLTLNSFENAIANFKFPDTAASIADIFAIEDYVELTQVKTQSTPPSQ